MAFPRWKHPPPGIAEIHLPPIYFLLFNGIQEESKDYLEYFGSSETTEGAPVCIFPCVPHIYIYLYCPPTWHFWGTEVYCGNTAASGLSSVQSPLQHGKLYHLSQSILLLEVHRKNTGKEHQLHREEQLLPAGMKHKAPVCLPHYVNLGGLPVASEMHQRDSERCSWDEYCGLCLFSSW